MPAALAAFVKAWFWPMNATPPSFRVCVALRTGVLAVTVPPVTATLEESVIAEAVTASGRSVPGT